MASDGALQDSVQGVNETAHLPKAYIVILNWNGWKDTIECLESVFRNNYPNFRVIVCDNDSTNGSVERIQDWADGNLQVQVDIKNPLYTRSFPPVEKPIRWVEYNREQAEAGGDREIGEPPLVLIRTGGNLGFAAGNNVGLRYALARNDFEYAWLLNNDTVIDASALTEMIRQMIAEPKSGMCGSLLLYYHEPEKVQTAGGGRYYKLLGGGRHISEGNCVSEILDRNKVLNRLDYIIGASMLVHKPFLQHVGLMCEDYFLYFEEIDWALRAKTNFSLTYTEKSIVYHKHGGSTRGQNEIGIIPEYYGMRNRLVFTRKFYPYALPAIYAGLAFACLMRLKKGRMDRVRMILKLLALGK